MTQVAEVGKQSETPKPVANGTSDPNAILQARLDEMQAQLTAVLGDNRELREELKRAKNAPVIATGAIYNILPATADGKYGVSLSVSLRAGGKPITGPRRKFVEIIEEVNSGRMQAVLDAHPEVK